MKNKKWLGPIFIILACLLWAFDTLIRYPMIGRGVSAIDIVFFEHLILLLPSLIVLKVRKFAWRKIDKMDAFSLLVIGGGGSAAATYFFTKSFLLLNPSVVIVLQKFQPVVAILLTKYVLSEKLDRSFLAWASLSMVGAILLSYTDVQQVLGLSTYSHLVGFDLFWAYLMVFLSIFLWGASTVFGRRLAVRHYHFTEIAALRFIFAFICLLPFSATIQWTNQVDQLQFQLNILTMVLLSGIMAMSFYYWGLKSVSAKNSSLLELFFPLFAIVINWVFLNKELEWFQILGALLLLFSSTMLLKFERENT
jgi:drug/metabolite transporter (DMT)-like permease